MVTVNIQKLEVNINPAQTGDGEEQRDSINDVVEMLGPIVFHFLRKEEPANQPPEPADKGTGAPAPGFENETGTAANKEA